MTPPRTSPRPLRHLGLVALLVGLATVAFVGGPAAPAEPVAESVADTFSLRDYPPGPAAERGADVYARFCIGCHGPEGEGDGAAALFLDPLPRNFQSARFKFRSTPSGELPTDEDLIHVVSCGLAGSAMRGFPLMPEPEKRDVVAYVRYLAEFGMVRREVEYVMDDDELTLDEVRGELLEEIVDEVLFDAYEEVWPVAVPQQPEFDDELYERGRELYDAQCVACHGAGGRGDGASSYHLRDWKDAEVRPRDFTTGVFRAGSTPADVFLRMKTGVNGTPMPSVYGSDEDLWAITHYILSMKDPEAAAGAVHPVSCEARHGGEAAR